MASEVSIANRALALVGDEPIALLTDANKRARACAALWPEIRDEVLRDHPWNSTSRRAQLAALATAPLFGWDLQYAWPADAVRIFSVNDDLWSQRVGWAIEGRVILTNWTAPIDVVYGIDETDVNLFDAQLRAALAYRLASQLAMPLTQNEGLAERLEARYERMKISAAITDGLEEDPVEDETESAFLGARFQ